MGRLRIGTDDFKKLRGECGYFVDKSRLIREVIDGATCLLLPRPRRFGKTLNLSMLRYFFEKCSEDRRPLFEDLQIAQDADAMAHQGQHPTIFMSLKDIKGSSWEVAREKLVDRIAKAYRGFADVQAGLPGIRAEAFERLCDGCGSDGDLADSLAHLISYLHTHHGQGVIVLIDEYDTPVIEAWSHGYYDEMINFMRGWLGAALKHEDGPALYRAVVTGILRVAKESLFSGLNNLDTWTTLIPGPFADKFGFTQEEVDKLLADFCVPELSQPIRDWYNGYCFGGTTIYNPWSVINAVNRHPAPIAPYWINTASNQLVHQELEAGGLPLKRDLEKLLAGDELRYPINESIIFADIGKGAQNIWSFLFYAGYLKAENPEPNPLKQTEITYRLSVPNLEVTVAYDQFVNLLFDGTPDGGVQPFLECFIEGRPAEELQRTLQPLVLALVSHHDVARRPEAVFHAFVLGLLANLREVYEIRSNAESGYGRADIMLRPKTDRYPLGYVIEFKSIDPSADAETALDEALAQIDDKAYAVELREAGVPDEQLHRLAIVLQGKQIYVRSAGNPQTEDAST